MENFATFFCFWIIIQFISFWWQFDNASTLPQQCAIAASAAVSIIFPYVLFQIISAAGNALGIRDTLHQVLKNQQTMIAVLKGEAIPEEPPKKKKSWWK